MTREQTVTVWQGRVRMRVLSAGAGPPLVFLHGPWGLAWDAFLDELARSFTVYAPEHPGTTPDAPDDIYHLDGLWDLVLCYDELLTALKLDEVVLVGHSFGGMVACELAAAYPRRVRRLALIDPLGFWRDAEPVVNWMMQNPEEMPASIFRDPNGEPARRMLGPSEPPEAAAAARVRLMWAMGTTGKFIWPIPDKGLKKRIHRVTAPTLIVWGKDDRLVPPVYADEFARRIPGARVQTVDGAGHAPHVEYPDKVGSVGRIKGGRWATERPLSDAGRGRHPPGDRRALGCGPAYGHHAPCPPGTARITGRSSPKMGASLAVSLRRTQWGLNLGS